MIQADPFTGTRGGVKIPDEPVSLWVGEGDGCQSFAVEVTRGGAVSVELACELGWVSLWASTRFTGR